jgi:hypothetical protein
MVMKTKLALLLLLLPALAVAQEQRTAKLYYNYDVSSTSYIYCKYTGSGGSPFGAELAGYGRIKTTGSSATLDELDSASDSFTGMAVGDLLIIRFPGTTTTSLRRIVTFTSVSQVVVDAAIDLGTAGMAFTWLRQSCGTAATDGWVDAGGFMRLNFERVLTTINATSIQTQVECQLNGLGTAIIATDSSTVAGTFTYPVSAGVWDSCRMGVKVTTDTGAQSLSGGMAYLSHPGVVQYDDSVTGPVVLTESSATPVLTLSVPQTATFNMTGGVVEWLVYAADATNSQTRLGMTYLSAVNEAGTEGCAVQDVGTTNDNTPTGTLTCSTSCVVGLTDVVQFALNWASPLPHTTLNARARFRPLIR